MEEENTERQNSVVERMAREQSPNGDESPASGESGAV